jgi:hypothetical protein
MGVYFSYFQYYNIKIGIFIIPYFFLFFLNMKITLFGEKYFEGNERDRRCVGPWEQATGPGGV